MKQRNGFETDLLKGYLEKAESEKAPDGFTDKIMMQIRTETVEASSSYAKIRRDFLPYVTAGITVMLILTTLLISETESFPKVLYRQGMLDQINSIMNGISFNWTLAISLPEIMVYVTVCIFLLLVFDRSLSRYFRQES